MRILITGSSGLLGTKLVSFLRERGHEVVRLVREPTANVDAIAWDPQRGMVSLPLLEGFTAVINLAGSNIASGLWSKKKKKALFQSRCRSTWLLSHSLVRLQRPPSLFLSASAIGFYGDRGESILTEESGPGKGFLSDLCVSWESASKVLEKRGTRVVHARLGNVMTPEGGMLKRLLPLFRLGLGFTLGKGEQWMSWISLEDMAYAFYHIMQTEVLQGAVNVTAPQSIRNKDFAYVLAKNCGRGLYLRLPAFLLRMALGEMGESLLLSSCRAFPQKLLNSGFIFHTPELESLALN